MYFVILAGGAGTRLWPRSRRRMPKQLLNLTSTEQTMLQETYARVADMAPADHFLVITSQSYRSLVREQLPQLPEANILGEPSGRGSAPAIGIAALLIHRRDPEAVMACLSADHFIARVDEFRRLLDVAQEAARANHLITMGIQPSYPETGYGYIQAGEPLMTIGEDVIYRVARFIEKPQREAAERFIAQGNFYWNAGIFIWRTAAILEALAQYMPDLHQRLMAIQAFWDEEGREGLLPEPLWSPIETETIDYGVMEKADNVAVIPADIGWSDVGNWGTLLELLPASDDTENVILGDHVGIDTRRSLIYSPHRLVATVGLEEMIIVDTGDAILICPKDRAQDVKRLVEALDRQGRHELL